jgi:hypothetical protein
MNTRFLSLAVFFLALAARPAYLESDHGKVADPQPEPPVHIPRPIPEPVDQPPLARLVDRLVIGVAQQYGQLTVYPLQLRWRHPTHQRLQALDAALGNGWLEIREREAASVNRLRVRNVSDHHLFLMAGEMILGGKQNRTIAVDVILPPRSGFIDIEVYCVEQGRWDAGVGFKSSSAVAAGSVRKLAAAAADQRSVWNDIDRQLSAAEVEANNSDYDELYKAPDVERRMREAIARLRMPLQRTVGVVAVVHGRIVAADIFSSANLFEALWPKLCRSYVTDVIVPFPQARREHWQGHPDIRGYLNQLRNSQFRDRGTPGLGRSWQMVHGMGGSVLEWQGGIVHTSSFGR